MPVSLQNLLKIGQLKQHPPGPECTDPNYRDVATEKLVRLNVGKHADGTAKAE